MEGNSNISCKVRKFLKFTDKVEVSDDNIKIHTENLYVTSGNEHCSQTLAIILLQPYLCCVPCPHLMLVRDL